MLSMLGVLVDMFSMRSLCLSSLFCGHVCEIYVAMNEIALSKLSLRLDGLHVCVF